MKSIMQADRETCWFCGTSASETHHVFGGALRRKSEEYGLTVRLCHDCHNEPPLGVHHCKTTMDAFRKAGQMAAMKKYGWTKDEFRQEFYKNYL